MSELLSPKSEERDNDLANLREAILIGIAQADRGEFSERTIADITQAVLARAVGKNPLATDLRRV